MRVDEVERLFSRNQTFLNERSEDPLFFIWSIKECANVPMPAEGAESQSPIV